MLIKNYKTLGTLVVSAAMAMALASNSFSGSKSDWADYRSWTQITKDRVSTGDPTGFIGGKHRGEKGYREIYVNDIGKSTILGTAPYKYPIGTIIVKEQYKNKAKWEKGKKPDLTVMVKVADSGTQDPKNWGFATGHGKVKYRNFCAGCHSIAAADDFVFTNGDFMSKQKH